MGKFGPSGMTLMNLVVQRNTAHAQCSLKTQTAHFVPLRGTQVFRSPVQGSLGLPLNTRVDKTSCFSSEAKWRYFGAQLTLCSRRSGHEQRLSEGSLLRVSFQNFRVVSGYGGNSVLLLPNALPSASSAMAMNSHGPNRFLSRNACPNMQLSLERRFSRAGANSDVKSRISRLSGDGAKS